MSEDSSRQTAHATLQGGAVVDGGRLTFEPIPDPLHEGDMIELMHTDGRKTNLYVQGTAREGAIRVVVGIAGDEAPAFEMSFDSAGVARPIVSDSTRDILKEHGL